MTIINTQEVIFSQTKALHKIEELKKLIKIISIFIKEPDKVSEILSRAEDKNILENPEFEIDMTLFNELPKALSGLETRQIGIDKAISKFKSIINIAINNIENDISSFESSAKLAKNITEDNIKIYSTNINISDLDFRKSNYTASSFNTDYFIKAVSNFLDKKEEDFIDVENIKDLLGKLTLTLNEEQKELKILNGEHEHNMKKFISMARIKIQINESQIENIKDVNVVNNLEEFELPEVKHNDLTTSEYLRDINNYSIPSNMEIKDEAFKAMLKDENGIIPLIDLIKTHLVENSEYIQSYYENEILGNEEDIYDLSNNFKIPLDILRTNLDKLLISDSITDNIIEDLNKILLLLHNMIVLDIHILSEFTNKLNIINLLLNKHFVAYKIIDKITILGVVPGEMPKTKVLEHNIDVKKESTLATESSTNSETSIIDRFKQSWEEMTILAKDRLNPIPRRQALDKLRKKIIDGVLIPNPNPNKDLDKYLGLFHMTGHKINNKDDIIKFLSWYRETGLPIFIENVKFVEEVVREFLDTTDDLNSKLIQNYIKPNPVSVKFIRDAKGVSFKNNKFYTGLPSMLYSEKISIMAIHEENYKLKYDIDIVKPDVEDKLKSFTREDLLKIIETAMEEIDKGLDVIKEVDEKVKNILPDILVVMDTVDSTTIMTSSTKTRINYANPTVLSLFKDSSKLFDSTIIFGKHIKYHSYNMTMFIEELVKALTIKN